MGSNAPQTFDRVTTLRFHLSILAALAPVLVMAICLHGGAVLLLAALAIGGAVAFDEVLRALRGTTVPRDWSAPLWGLWLTLLLPVDAPWYLPLLGTAFAIFVVKGVFGGSGTPWLNPVLASWAFLQVGWPSAFSGLVPLSADHRTLFDQQGTDWLNTNVFSWVSVQLPPGYLDMVVGLGHGGSGLVVESGTLMLLAATVFLLAKGYFPWEVPAFFFLGFCIPSMAFGGNLLYQVFAGSLLLNLFFLAADPANRPLSRTGLIVFASGAGIFAFFVRTWGVGSDGVGYAVLLMNLFVPWIDRKFRRKTLSDFRLA